MSGEETTTVWPSIRAAAGTNLPSAPAISKPSRARAAGAATGFLCGAFLPDGSMKEQWKARTLRLIREAGRLGMAVDLRYFYQSQDEALMDQGAIRNAVTNATGFLIDNDLRNVIIEIANKQDIRGWDHECYVDRDMGALMEIARERFAAKKAAFRLPISASSGGSMKLFDSIPSCWRRHVVAMETRRLSFVWTWMRHDHS